MSSKSKSKASLYQHVQSQLVSIDRQEMKPLSQIKDLNGAVRLLDSKFKMKEDSVRGSNAELSTKKAPIRKVENKENNKQIDDSVLKMISYTNLSRNIEQKNGLIERQKEEIQVLKQCVNDIKTNNQARQTEEERIRKQEIAKLKQQEKEYSQNLKDLQLMKGHFKEIKKKYDTAVSQKQSINEKYLKLLGQNEELTLVISNLKQELENGTGTQRILDMEQEIAHLRQDLKNYETQKESNEIRSSNFQKRMNQYILKYNEVQGVLSQAQIKYYKLQKDCDNLKLDKEEVEQKLGNLSKQVQAQRQIHEQQLLLLKSKFKKYDEESMQKDKKIQQLLENESKQDSGVRIQQLARQLKRMQDENAGLRQQNALQIKKWQRYVKQLMRHCGQQLQDKLRNCKMQYEEILMNKERQLQNLVNLLQKNKMDLSSKDEAIKTYEVQIAELQEEIDEQREQEQKIIQKISVLQKQINQGNDYLQGQNQILKVQNQRLSDQVRQSIKLVQQKENEVKMVINQKQALTNETKVKLQSQTAIRQQLQRLIKQIQALQLEKRFIRDEQSKQKRYYQQKYEREIQQYNELSQQFNQLQTENRKLLRINAENTLQISNLKAELHLMKQEIENFLKEEEESHGLKCKLSDIQRANMDAKQKAALYERKAKQLDEYLLQMRNEMFTLKQVNLKLKEQYESACAQREDLKYKLGCNYNFYQSEQAKHFAQIMGLSDKVRLMQEDISAKNRTLVEKDIIIGRVKEQLEQHVQEIRFLSENVLIAEKKYQNLVEKYHHQANQWQNEKSKWKWELQCHENERKVLEHSRMSADYSLDSSQAVVEILREENKQLQLILGGEIQRRNATIRQLINQKKTLFSQLIQK